MKWTLGIVAGIVLLTFFQLQDETERSKESERLVKMHSERIEEIERDNQAIIHNMKVLEEHIEERDGVQIDFMAKPLPNPTP